MSGTSADGVDACLAQIDERDGKLEARIEAFLTEPYPPTVRKKVLEARSVEDVCRLNFELGELFARAALHVCSKAAVDPADVHAIGSHGQTVCHLPNDRGGKNARPTREHSIPAVGRTFLSAQGATLQIGEPCVIAQRTGITTVADFRPRDVAAGGAGAPLVPIVDFLLLADSGTSRAALNIGGIANVTILPAACTVDQVIAFDTGPGNMVIDGLIELLTDGRETCDRGGATAARGSADEELLAELLGDDYFDAPPPKSTGRERFGRAFAEGLMAAGRSRGLSGQDIVATATALTARTIADAVTRWGSSAGRGIQVIASGGGVHNAAMMTMLREALPDARLAASDEFGIPADAKEALAFAVLAYLTLNGMPGNLTGATGARERVVLGKIVPGSGKEAWNAHDHGRGSADQGA